MGFGDFSNVSSFLFDCFLFLNFFRLCSRQPSTIAAASIATAVEQNREKNIEMKGDLSLNTIALFSNIAEGTLKNFLKEIKEIDQGY